MSKKPDNRLTVLDMIARGGNDLEPVIINMMLPREPMKLKRPWWVRLFDRLWKPLQQYYDCGPDYFPLVLTFKGWFKKKFARKKPEKFHSYSSITTEYRLVEEGPDMTKSFDEMTSEEQTAWDQAMKRAALRSARERIRRDELKELRPSPETRTPNRKQRRAIIAKNRKDMT